MSTDHPRHGEANQGVNVHAVIRILRWVFRNDEQVLLEVEYNHCSVAWLLSTNKLLVLFYEVTHERFTFKKEQEFWGRVTMKYFSSGDLYEYIF